MKRTRKKTPKEKTESLNAQIKDHAKKKKTKKKKPKYEGNTELTISTGSTLLDLAISGGRKRGGGLFGGTMVVGYGPSGAGKTVLACEIAGAIQRAGGELKYEDSEARLNKVFARTFDLNTKILDVGNPDTIPEAFIKLHKWQPKNTNIINGYIIDSLAALSTAMEMENDDGDKMGGRRAKEFSAELRKGKVKIKKKNMLLFCTNQIRDKMDAYKNERKDVNPGGHAIEFYSSLIMRFSSFKKIWKKIKIKGKEEKRAIGIEGELEIVKSSIWKPFRTAPITIFFDYGIDDIRENLKYIKRFTGATVYKVNNTKLSNELDKAIEMVEENELEDELKEQVIDLWEEVENKFEIKRKKKKR
jgi:RecA/RadA recombinase